MQLFLCFHSIQGVNRVAEASPLHRGFGVCCLAVIHQSKSDASLPQGGLQAAGHTQPGQDSVPNLLGEGAFQEKVMHHLRQLVTEGASRMVVPFIFGKAEDGEVVIHKSRRSEVMP
jgi:hypothetical protein